MCIIMYVRVAREDGFFVFFLSISLLIQSFLIGLSANGEIERKKKRDKRKEKKKK